MANQHKKGYKLKLSTQDASTRTKKAWITRHRLHPKVQPHKLHSMIFEEDVEPDEKEAIEHEGESDEDIDYWFLHSQDPKYGEGVLKGQPRSPRDARGLAFIRGENERQRRRFIRREAEKEYARHGYEQKGKFLIPKAYKPGGQTKEEKAEHLARKEIRKEPFKFPYHERRKREVPLRTIRLIEHPDRSGVLVHEPTTKDRPYAKDAAKQKEVTVTIPQRPEGYTIEDVYKQHGQEEHDNRGILNIGKGWKSTLAFNRGQHERFKKTIDNHEYQMGWTTWQKSGDWRAQRQNPENSDIGVRANKEIEYKTTRWKLDHPLDKQERSTVEFRLTRPPGETTRKSNEGIEVLRENVADVLSRQGLTNYKKEFTTEKVGGQTIYKYRIVSPEGKIINPDQADDLAEFLEQEFPNQVIRDAETGEAVTHTHPSMSPVIIRQPFGSSKVKGVPKADVISETVLEGVNKNKFDYKLGMRDPDTGELWKDHQDTLTAKIPGREERAYINLKDRSESIGWGKSWRPGEKEIGQLATAVPRARENERIKKAVEAYDTGDTRPLAEIMTEKDPYIADSPEAQERMRRQLSDHVKEAGAAGLAAGYYSAKKATKHSGLRRAYTGATTRIEKLPGVKNVSEKYDIFPTLKAAYVEPGVTKLAKAEWMMRYPSRDIRDRQGRGAEVNFRPIDPLPSVRYRKWLIKKETREKREQERVSNMRNKLKLTKTQINEQINMPKEDVKQLGVLGRIKRNYYLQHADPWRVKAKEYDEQIKEKGLHTQIETLPYREKGEKVGPKARERAKTAAHKELSKRFPGIERKDVQFKVRGTGRKWETIDATAKPNRLMIHPETVTDAKLARASSVAIKDAGEVGLYSKAAKVGKFGLIGAGVAAGSIYLYDKHAEKSQGKEPRIKARIPETISVPKVTTKVTNKYQIPKNNITHALDVDKKNIVTGARIGVAKKQVRLRGHKDISGEPYERGPIVGKVRGANVKNTGSWGNSFFYEQPQAKNRYMPRHNHLYVAGHKTPIFVDVGKEERWKKGKLKTKNPKKIKQEEREKIALIYRSGTESDRAAINQVYGQDEKIWDMVQDDNTMADLNRKHNVIYKPGTQKVASSRKMELTPRQQESVVRYEKREKRESERLAAKMSAGRAGSEFTEDAQRQQAAERRELRSSKRERSSRENEQLRNQLGYDI